MFRLVKQSTRKKKAINAINTNINVFTYKKNHNLITCKHYFTNQKPVMCNINLILRYAYKKLQNDSIL